MSINYGDSGLIVNYIQMFLKEYYSKFIDTEYEYSRDIQKLIIDYINSYNSVTMNEISFIISMSEFDSIHYNFKQEDKVDEIVFTSKVENIKGYPDKSSDQAVSWIYDNIKNFDSFILKHGWHVSNYNYRNSNNKCEIIINKINVNVLPKDRLVDLINMFDKIYNEIAFGKSNRVPSPPSDYFFSSLYNFEIKNYEYEITEKENKYSLFLPFNMNYKVCRKNGMYNIYYTSDIDLINPLLENFRGFKTLVSNIMKSDEDQYYIVHLKIPNNYKIIDDYNNYFPVMMCISKDIGKRQNVDYTEVSSDELENLNIKFITKEVNDDKYVTLYLKIPERFSDGSYKLCITFYDKDNEINDMLSFKLDNNFIKRYPENDFQLIDNLNNYKYWFDTKIISAEEYYSDPYAINNKLLSYILEAIVHEYSREDDIILIQKLANKLGYSYDEFTYGTYDENLIKFISSIQDSKISKSGSLVEYGKGYVDPYTESILNSLIGGE